MHALVCSIWGPLLIYIEIILTSLTADSELNIIIWIHRSGKQVISQQLHLSSDDLFVQ